MASPLQVHLLLCDGANSDTATGKLNMLGAGWTSTSGPPTAPHALAAMIRVPWDRTNQPLRLTVDLLTEDGKPVQVETPEGTQTMLHFECDVEAGRPPGTKAGSDVPISFALQVTPLLLPKGRYEYQLRVAEQTVSEPFDVR